MIFLIYIAYILGFVLLAIFLLSLLSTVFRFIRKPPDNTVVFVPITDAIILCCFIISAVIFTFVLLNDKDSDVTAIIIVESLLLILFGSAMLWLANFKIVFDEEGFCRRNFLGFKRFFSYEQITAYSGKPNEDYAFYIGRKKIFVDRYTFNGKEFFNYTRKRYTEIHSGRYMPVYKDDIFKGNIKNPDEFILICGFISVISVAVSCLVIHEYITYEPVVYDELSYSKTTFYSFDYSDDNYILSSGEHELEFKISANPKYTKNISMLQAGCNRYSKFNVYYKSTDKYNFICDLSDEYGNVYLTLENYNAQHNGKSPINIVLAAFFFLVALMFPAMIIVGRNPKKYKSIVHWFFKDSYINWEQ